MLRSIILITTALVIVIAIARITTSPSDGDAIRAAGGPVPTAVPDKAAIQNARWAEFLRYGPELVGLITKSDEIDRIHATGAQIVTTATRGEFYNLTNRAAQQNATLKRQANDVRVPAEAKAFKDLVFLALIHREEAYNKLKESLDRPSAATEGASLTAKQQANRTTTRAVAALFALCESMAATTEECRSASGLIGH